MIKIQTLMAVGVLVGVITPITKRNAPVPVPDTPSRRTVIAALKFHAPKLAPIANKMVPVTTQTLPYWAAG